MENKALTQEDFSDEEENKEINIKDDISDNYQNSVSKSSPALAKDNKITTSERQWRNAERVKQGRKLKSSSKIRLLLLTLTTPIAFFWVFSLSLNLLLFPFNFLLVKIQNLFAGEFTKIHVISLNYLPFFLVILVIISPWLLDAIFKHSYNFSSLSISQLKNKSPESVKLLTKYCEQRNIPLPSLKLLPTSCPIAITYGNHPRNTSIVISRGLLTQLTDEEIATVYGTQLGHIINKDVIWITAIVTLLQIPYSLHSWCADCANQWKLPVLSKILLLLSTLCYGVYQFWRLPVLWLSRQRILDSDRQSVQLTRNPNALSRALLKISIGISQKTQQQGYTLPLLDSFNLLLPVEPRQVISLGSLPPDIPFESVLSWDCINPYRHWLALFDSHPLLGERLYLLRRYAKFWNLESELDLSDNSPSWQTQGELWSKLINSYRALPILPASILFALGLGTILRCVFWLIGKVSSSLNFKSLAWLDTSFILLNAWVVWVFILVMVIGLLLISDRHPHIFAWVISLWVMMRIIKHWSGGRLNWFDSVDPLFNACCLIVFSFSLILWLNRYFPHPNNTSVINDPNLVDLLSDPIAVPGQTKLIRISGILLGYPKVNHWLRQELILQTSTGLIKLHFLGLLGNVLPWSWYPKQLIKKTVTIQGWFRRGSFPVIEVDAFKSAQGEIIRSGSTHFIFILIIISAFLATYLIMTN